MNYKNINSLDLAKFIASIFVVAIHANPFRGTFNTIVIEGYARFAVPFFFITSAYLFFRRSPQKADLRHFAWRICLLYGFWFVFNLPHYCYYRMPNNLATFLHNLFLGSTFGASWFLMALLEATVLVWLLSRKMNNWLLFAAGYLVLLLNQAFSPPQPLRYKDYIG